jgi:hypothetical protein
MLNLLQDPSADKNITLFEKQEEQKKILMLPNSEKM